MQFTKPVTPSRRACSGIRWAAQLLTQVQAMDVGERRIEG